MLPFSSEGISALAGRRVFFRRPDVSGRPVTYVIDVRDDGHVADVVLLVHLATELIDGELRGGRTGGGGMGRRPGKGRNQKVALLSRRVSRTQKKHETRRHKAEKSGFTRGTASSALGHGLRGAPSLLAHSPSPF
jgi:hypothetical protein